MHSHQLDNFSNQGCHSEMLKVHPQKSLWSCTVFIATQEYLEIAPHCQDSPICPGGDTPARRKIACD